MRRQGAQELGGRTDPDAVTAASRLEVLGVASNQGVRTPGGGNFQKGQGKSCQVPFLSAPTNRLGDLRPVVPALLKMLPLVQKGEVREIGA